MRSADPRDWNPDRNRWYGKRVGDLVYNWADESTARRTGKEIKREIGEVTYLESMDANRIHVLYPDSEKPVPEVAEWCEIVKTVEDRIRDGEIVEALSKSAY